MEESCGHVLLLACIPFSPPFLAPPLKKQAKYMSATVRGRHVMSGLIRAFTYVLVLSKLVIFTADSYIHCSHRLFIYIYLECGALLSF